MRSRRQFLREVSAVSLAMTAAGRVGLAAPYAAGAVYQNPILGGDHPDASPIRVGEEFYLTHSSFDYAPGLLIWHSRDLVNWRPVATALRKYLGSVWAPYLCEHAGRFYLYFPAGGRIHVVHAGHPTGPWSEPVDLGIRAIDPAHIAEGGRRFLYTNGGKIYELAADGLSVKSGPEKGYTAWPVPAGARMECTCVEGPKLLERNGYFYLTVAEGGTGGPATSHAVVSMRSRHAQGPWEFSPYNPIARTQSRSDRWLSVGHGRLVDTAAGDWFLTAHAYENGFRTLGRQLLLLPVEWTEDDWFRIKRGYAADASIPMPVPGARQEPFVDPSDDFTAAELGLQWGFWHEYDTARFETGKGFLRLGARGATVDETPALTTPVGGHDYTVEVDVELEAGCEAGLLLFYKPGNLVGILLGPGGLRVRAGNGKVSTHAELKSQRATLRVVNESQEVDFYYRFEGEPWRRTEESAEISGLHHNVLGGFLDVRPALAAWGSGAARFRRFRYWPRVVAGD